MENLPPTRRVKLTSTCLPWLLLGPSFYWIFHDQHVWPWDQAWYGEVAVDLWWKLAHTPRQWCEAMLEAFGSKSPGVAWLGQFFVPLGDQVGSVESGLLLSVVLCSALTLFFLMDIGTFLWQEDRRGGWLMALFAAACPLFIGMNHQFMVESMQLLGVTYVLWLAAVGEGKSRLWLCAHGFMAVSLAMLAKASSPLYCGFAGLIFLARILVTKQNCSPRHSKEQFLELFYLTIALLLCVATFAWYLHNLARLREHIVASASGGVAMHYGRSPQFWPKWKFWVSASQEAVTLPSIALMVVLLTLSSLIVRLVKRPKLLCVDQWGKVFMFAGAGTVLLTLVLFTTQINDETRYLLPLLPSFLSVVVGLLGRVHRPLAFGGALALGLFQWGMMHAVALGCISAPATVSVWLKPLAADRTHKNDLNAVIGSTTTMATSAHYNLIGYEADWFNANTLTFYAAKRRLSLGYRCFYTSIGYAPSDVQASWAQIESVRPVAFISLSPDFMAKPPDFLNQVALPILERIAQSPKYAKAVFPNQSGIVIYQRIGP